VSAKGREKSLDSRGSLREGVAQSVSSIEIVRRLQSGRWVEWQRSTIYDEYHGRIVGCGANRDEPPRHQPALSGVQIEPAATGCLDPLRVLLDQIDEVFELAWAPVEAVNVPNDDAARPSTDLRDHRVAPRKATTVERTRRCR
jgi:hypothetical protein